MVTLLLGLTSKVTLHPKKKISIGFACLRVVAKNI